MAFCMFCVLLPCSLCRLSLVCFRALPALHSFPTRRSSDLFWRNWYEIIGMIPLSHPALRSFRLLRVVVVVARVARADRKSTRLNSSHVAISYAVFCLKKKTRANLRRTIVYRHHTLTLTHWN